MGFCGEAAHGLENQEEDTQGSRVTGMDCFLEDCHAVNLTKSETTMLHVGKGRTQQWTLVRNEQPAEPK